MILHPLAALRHPRAACTAARPPHLSRPLTVYYLVRRSSKTERPAGRSPPQGRGPPQGIAPGRAGSRGGALGSQLWGQ